MANQPRPYLTRDEINERLKALGFIIDEAALDFPPGFQKAQFVALQELIAAAIAGWADVEPSDDIRIDQVNQELLEFAEEYLVG